MQQDQSLNTTVPMTSAEKSAVKQLASASGSDLAKSIVRLIAKVGDHDGPVSFTPPQSEYLVDHLIPWAKSSFKFESKDHNKLGFTLLDIVKRKLRGPSEDGDILVFTE